LPIAPDLSGLALDGRYELHAIIGEGTFGRVYRGRDRRLARWVAVKVIKPWWAEDPEWARSFEREAQLLASISDPGIIQIFDVGSAREGLYYVAELVDGESLAARLRRGRVAPREARQIALQLARALARAHSQRVVHRDVKPANVLITTDGRVKVGDFGVARLAEGSSDVPAATIAGTPGYMAPEQASGGVSSPATDVYGVGIVLYEMLAGQTPFAGKSAVELALQHVNEPPPPLPARTPPALARIVERALAKDPAERYRDGHELAAALSDVPTSTRREEGEEQAGAASASGRASATAIGSRAASGGERAPAANGRAPSRADSGRDAATTVTIPPSTPSGGVLISDEEPIPRTRVKPRRPPRRNFNPSERRQRNALLVLAVAVAAAMAVVALEIAPGHLSVPELQGMTKGRIISAAHRDGFHSAFSGLWSNRPVGTAIGQNPAPGTRVGDGATVQVTLSRGPKPVSVPDLVGHSAKSAQASLAALKLRSAVTQVPAPGVTAGTVTRQVPSAGARRVPGSTISLWAAEAPQLRPLTSFSSAGDGTSVPFRIRGSRWEVVYSMGFQSTCTFIFFCSGPSAKVTNVGTGATVDHFGLGEGSSEDRVIKSGPGVYQISVSPGDDSANWQFQVDDYY
jgi:serine/threonine-protein kinase